VFIQYLWPISSMQCFYRPLAVVMCLCVYICHTPVKRRITQPTPRGRRDCSFLTPTVIGGLRFIPPEICG